jgi:hypothetical protein
MLRVHADQGKNTNIVMAPCFEPASTIWQVVLQKSDSGLSTVAVVPKSCRVAIELWRSAELLPIPWTTALVFFHRVSIAVCEFR